VSIIIKNVELKDISDDNNTATLNVVFNIKNPTSQALTTSKIDYELIADGKSLGEYSKSFIDIPVNGRPQLLSNTDTNISSIIETPIKNQAFRMNLIQNNQTMQNMDWTVNGNAIIESGFSSAPKTFNATW
jgi:flagellar capping protein FliD